MFGGAPSSRSLTAGGEELMEFKKFYYAADEVVIFIDEAGDERRADTANPVFALGCCLATGKDLNHLRARWMDVRKQVRGDSDKPLHMRTLSRRLSDERDAYIRTFFTDLSFGRMSIAITDQTVIDHEGIPEPPVISLALSLLLNSTAKIMSGRFSQGLCLVFERSHLENKILAIAPQKRLNLDGVPIPVSWAFLPKSEREPALEIADYIAHSTAGFMRTKRANGTKFDLRYKAIFPAGSPHAIGLELNEAVIDASSIRGDTVTY